MRNGRSVTITWRGEPVVAEIRPVDSRSGVQALIERLAERGLVTPRTGRSPFQPVAHRPGALERFLEERDQPRPCYRQPITWTVRALHVIGTT